MTDRELCDAEARRRIREDLDTTLVVEAAAGTGKTSALVGRITAALCRGKATLDRIVAVTFTDKAAGEMKLRLRREIEERRQDASEQVQGRLDAALAALETAHLGTIHSFCADVLRERPLEAQVDPAFEVLGEAEAEQLLERALDDWLRQALTEPDEGLRRLLRRGGAPRAVALEACRQLSERRDYPTRWRRDPAFDRNHRIDLVVAELQQLGALAERAGSSRDPLARALQQLATFTSQLQARERISPRDHDALEAELARLSRDIWQWQGSGADYGPGLLRADVLERREAVRKSLRELLADCQADLAACLQQELSQVVAAHEQLKRRAGVVDYVDLLLLVRDLLRNHRGVRRELQERFSHVFVDEFQDTDPLQAEILLLLCADDPEQTELAGCRPVPGKLFVVGDPKQAIYRFRRADVRLYEQIKAQLLQQGGGELLYLSTSFRSVPAIQQTVNAAFEPWMTAGGQTYVPLHPYRPPLPVPQPAVIALPVPEPYSKWGNITKAAVSASTAEAVTAFVDWLVRRSGWQVSPDGEPEPLQSKHICLLFRRFRAFYEPTQDVTRPYVRGLEARRIPHVLLGGHSYYAREEVSALRSALTAVEWPGDELLVYATLRGPFFSFADEALLLAKQKLGHLHPLRCPAEPAAELRAVAGALQLLGRLHRRRNRRPIGATIAELLAETRAHANIAFWPTGEQALANVLRALDEARRFESRGATSFRSFIDHLEREAAGGRGADAPVLEEDTDGVRIMTVHAAKGLELPVVILCDPTMPRVSQRPSRYVDPERRLWAFPLAGQIPWELRDNADEVLADDGAETVRLGYVAATRARDLLVIPAVGDERPRAVPAAGDERRPGTWLELFNNVLYPPDKQRRQARAAPGCPPFGPDSVRHRPGRCQTTEADSVAPGWHDSAAGTAVVWWDPCCLALDTPPLGGVRQQDLLAADQQSDAEQRGLLAFEQWRAERQHTLAQGGRPSVTARPITQIAHADEPPADEAEKDVSIERTAACGEPRPGGKRFGTLVHSVLEEIDLSAGESQARLLTEFHGRRLDADPPEIEAAVRAVVAALGHPLLRRAAASADCRREAPVTLQQADGTLAEGVVDLVFREGADGGGALWIVVDFKTDLAGAVDPAYLEQVRLYATAVSAATGELAEPLLLGV